MPLRFVLDTDVIVAASRSKTGASRQLLYGALAEEFRLLLSVPLILEYEAVLTRPEHLSFVGSTEDEVGRVLDDLIAVADPVNIDYRWRPQLTDPDDEMVLETAVNGNADAIVTFNRQDFAAVRDKFQCAVILPVEALAKIRSSLI